MKSFGFSDDVLREGWARLEATAELAMMEEPSAGPNPKIVEQLDQFENVWFGVTKATLKSNFPAVHDALFAKLSQASGRDVAMTVGTFLKRVREMEAGEGAYSEEGQAARALLAERGLTEDVVVEAEKLIAGVKTTVKVDESEWTTKEREEKAFAHLWDWYLEWSAIARIAVKDRRRLRSMGFLNSPSSAKDTEEETDDESDSETDAVKKAAVSDRLETVDPEKSGPVAAE